MASYISQPILLYHKYYERDVNIYIYVMYDFIRTKQTNLEVNSISGWVVCNRKLSINPDPHVERGSQPTRRVNWPHFPIKVAQQNRMTPPTTAAAEISGEPQTSTVSATGGGWYL